MTRILNTTAFPIDTNVSDSDYVIGTDADNNKKTKNFLVRDLKTHILGFNDSLPVDGLENSDSTYTWVKYSANSDGSAMSDYPEGLTYIGLAYNQTVATESTDPLDYTWSLYESAILQPNGKYTWLKYAMTPDAENLYDLPDNMEWIGFAFDKEVSDESIDYKDYEWHRFAQSFDDTLVQNNLVRVIQIAAADLTSEDEQGIADYINANGLTVYEDENVLFEITGATPTTGTPPDTDEENPPIPKLNPDITLDLTIGAVTETTAVLNWNPNGDTVIVRYNLYIKEVVLGNSYLNTYTTELTDTLTGLTDGIQYEVYLVGYDTLGTSKTSNTVVFSTPETFVPSTPNISATGITDLTIDLAWTVDPVFNADRYELFQVGTGIIYDGTSLNFQVTGLTDDTLYQFYVTAYSEETASNPSATLDVTTLATIAPPLSTPIVLMSRVTTSSIDIVIKILPSLAYELDRILGWQVQYRISGNTTWAVDEFPATIMSITGLLPDTSYDIRVRSFDGESFSDWSDIATTKTLAVATTTGAVMNLSTNTPPAAEGYFWVTKGAKNGTVTIRFSFTAMIGTTHVNSTITLPYFGETVLSQGSRTFTLNLNGGGNSTLSDGYFVINVGSHIGITYRITTTIISSSNGLGTPYSRTVTYTNLTVI